jgi:hypothetical protein
MIFAYFSSLHSITEKTDKFLGSRRTENELVLAIRPLFVPDVDDRDNRSVPALVSHCARGLSPFFHGTMERELARKVHNHSKSWQNERFSDRLTWVT